MRKQQRPFGSWESAIEASEVYRSNSAITDVTFDKTLQTLFWIDNVGLRSRKISTSFGLHENKSLSIGYGRFPRSKIYTYGGGSIAASGGFVAVCEQSVDGQQMLCIGRSPDGSDNLLLHQLTNFLPIEIGDLQIDLYRKRLVFLMEDQSATSQASGLHGIGMGVRPCEKENPVCIASVSFPDLMVDRCTREPATKSQDCSEKPEDDQIISSSQDDYYVPLIEALSFEATQKAAPDPTSKRSSEELHTKSDLPSVCIGDTYQEKIQSLVGHHDFFSSPTLSPDCSRMAWISWEKPFMPWDNTELWVAEFQPEDGAIDPHSVTNIRLTRDRILQADVPSQCKEAERPTRIPVTYSFNKTVASPSCQSPCIKKRKVQPQPPSPSRQEQLENGESIIMPKWSPDGNHLYFVSDIDNWWAIYRCNLPSKRSLRDICSQEVQIERISPVGMEAEFGEPLWGVGLSSYGIVSSRWLVCAYSQNSRSYLAKIDLENGLKFHQLRVFVDRDKSNRDSRSTTKSDSHMSEEFTEFSQVRSVDDAGVVFACQGPCVLSTLMFFDPWTDEFLQLSQTTKATSRDHLSNCKALVINSKDTLPPIYGLFYPPYNPNFCGLATELPPLIIKTHGGPTDRASTKLDNEIHFFTSRGFALIDLNYRGSTGYGRHFRLSLYGNWGLHDRDDCVRAAIYLSDKHLIDIDRVVARGVSAGGYLTIVQATQTSLLKAGASYSGISNLLLLYHNTHKFEKYYLLQLVGADIEHELTSGNFSRVGKLQDSDQKQPEHTTFLSTYKMRSPYYQVGMIRTPMIFFQGLQDRIVPPNQTFGIVSQLRDQGIPTGMLLYRDESHGISLAHNIKEALLHELYFFSQVLGFQLPDCGGGNEFTPKLEQFFNWPPSGSWSSFS